MVAYTRQTPGGRRNTEHRVLERAYVCGRELSDEAASIVADYDPVDVLHGPGVLNGYYIRFDAAPRCFPSARCAKGRRTCARHAGHTIAADMRWRSATTPTIRPYLRRRHCAIPVQRSRLR